MFRVPLAGRLAHLPWLAWLKASCRVCGPAESQVLGPCLAGCVQATQRRIKASQSCLGTQPLAQLQAVQSGDTTALFSPAA